jgi:hypothetical protein
LGRLSLFTKSISTIQIVAFLIEMTISTFKDANIKGTDFTLAIVDRALQSHSVAPPLRCPVAIHLYTI